jgi:ABC-type multidrug transport system fused ATPase/permease subunit
VLRPLFFGLHDLLVHQTISPGMTSLIRWQNHSYVLKQSLNFFQNDFAGRIAQRIMQTGNSLRDSAVQAVDALWHVLIYAISSLVLFAEADWRLMIPLLTWIAATSRAVLLRATGEGTLGDLLRCALQTDGAHRRRLHQHRHPEAVRPHRLRTAIRPRSDPRTDRKTQLAARGDQHGRGHHP